MIYHFLIDLMKNVIGQSFNKFLKLIFIDLAMASFQYDVIQTSNQVTTAVPFHQNSLAMSRRYPIYLKCGYKDAPVIHGAIFTWTKGGKSFGPNMTYDSMSYHEPDSFSLVVNSDQRGTTLILLPRSPEQVYGQYFCSVNTPAQTFQLQGTLVQVSDYEVSIIAPTNVTEYYSLTFQCQANYTMGNETGTEEFFWYRDSQLLSAS